ncbi:MAG: hypothetical protein L3J00_01780 [Thiomicrorhabdus sp.]|nr:hypothetical protein [Thiomicrorhabdus sp.]
MTQKTKQKTLILGDEYDDKLREKLMHFLQTNNAIILNTTQQIAGSQDIETLTVSLFGHNITIEAETYIGLSITGPEKVIEYVQKEFLSST